MSTETLSITYVFRYNMWKIVLLMLLCVFALLGIYSLLFTNLFFIGSSLLVFVCSTMAVVSLFHKQFFKAVSWLGMCAIAIAIVCIVCAFMPTTSECVAKCIAENMGVRASRLEELWHCHGPDAVFVFRLNGGWCEIGKFQEETFNKWKKKIVADCAFYAAQCNPPLKLDIGKPIYWCFRGGYVIYVVGIKDGYAIFYFGL